MIDSKLGTVLLTEPDYELAERLEMSHESADTAIKAMLSADLTAILYAFVERYGLDEALDMWYHSAEVYIKIQKGEHKHDI